MEITIEKLTKVFKDRVILNTLDLSVKSGEFVCIAGENGTGKTTFLRIICGLDTEFSGTVLYDGKNYSKALIRQITLVFQQPMMMHTSVINNVTYALKLRKIPQADKIAHDMLERMGIAHLRKQRATTLSGGERQKLAIARALAFEPRLLMLDEPTSNIDQNSIDRIESALTDFHRRTHATILMVTHDKEQAKRLSHRIITL